MIHVTIDHQIKFWNWFAEYNLRGQRFFDIYASNDIDWIKLESKKIKPYSKPKSSTRLRQHSCIRTCISPTEPLTNLPTKLFVPDPEDKTSLFSRLLPVALGEIPVLALLSSKLTVAPYCKWIIMVVEMSPVMHSNWSHQHPLECQSHERNTKQVKLV